MAIMACSGFPECKNTKKIVQETGGNCPYCGKKVLLKKSKRARSYGCEDNPECKFMTWDVLLKKMPERWQYAFPERRKERNTHSAISLIAG